MPNYLGYETLERHLEQAGAVLSTGSMHSAWHYQSTSHFKGGQGEKYEEVD